MPAFLVKLGTNDLNCVDVPLNPTHSWVVTTDVFVKVSSHGYLLLLMLQACSE